MIGPEPLAVEVHGTTVEVHVPAALPGQETEGLRAALAAELAPFPRVPPGSRAGAAVRLRTLREGEEPEALRRHPDWLGAWVTPWLLLRARPAPPLAELVVLGPGPRDELVLATWARVVDAAAAARPPGAPPRAAFHAATAGRGDAGVLLLGESDAGKTSLSRALTHVPDAPLDYLGDEDALVELSPSGPRLLALPRRIRLVGPAAEGLEIGGPVHPFRGFGEEGVLLDRPRERAPRLEAPLTAVVELRPERDAQAGPARLERLDPAHAAFACLAGLERHPAPPEAGPALALALAEGHRRGARVCAGLAAVPAYRLVYPQPEGFEDAAARVRELLEDGSR